MNKNRRYEANALFEQIVELPSGERAAALDQACVDDPWLRETLERLLRADSEAGDQDFLGRPPSVTGMGDNNPLSEAPRPAPDAPIPDRIGRYKILDRLGSGGMGTIYRAAPEDDPQAHPVAIKVIRGGAEDQHLVRRMHQERRILSRLQHPNIARIYDLGSTQSGSPYFVMELVEGLPLDQYCDRNGLDIDSRLQLIHKVCRAVEYANGNLVIHRDLKPSNILVTPEGEPKLLDFGIAKILDPNPEDSTRGQTRTDPWQQRLTLEYASPEHIRGLPVSVSGDVYSLGVLLFQLLTGGLPRSAEGLTPWSFERLLSTTDPPRPSEWSGNDRANNSGSPIMGKLLNGRPAGDLDSIVLCALQEDLDHRYSSAKDLGDDLQRYLDGFPVKARHGSLPYRLGKFVRRNSRPLAAATTIFAMGLASWTYAEVQENRARDLIMQENLKRGQLIESFVEVFKHAGPLVAEGVDLGLLEGVQRFLEPEVEDLEEQPDLQAAMASTLGWINLELGQFSRAMEFHSMALEIRKLRDAPEVELTESLMGLATVHANQGDYELAKEKGREALVRVQNSEDMDDGLRLKLTNRFVEILCHEGKSWQEVEGPSIRAIELAQGLDPSEAELHFAWSQRARVLKNLGQVEEAKKLYRQTADTVTAIYGPQHPILAAIYNNLASIFFEEKDYQRALEVAEQADRTYSQGFGKLFFDRTKTLRTRALALKQLDRKPEAIAVFKQALQVAETSPMLKPKHQATYFGQNAFSLGKLLIEADRCPELLEIYGDRHLSWGKHPMAAKAAEQIMECRARLGKSS